MNHPIFSKIFIETLLFLCEDTPFNDQQGRYESETFNLLQVLPTLSDLVENTSTGRSVVSTTLIF